MAFLRSSCVTGGTQNQLRHVLDQSLLVRVRSYVCVVRRVCVCCAFVSLRVTCECVFRVPAEKIASVRVAGSSCCQQKGGGTQAGEKSNCILTFVHFEVKRSLRGVLIGHFEILEDHKRERRETGSCVRERRRVCVCVCERLGQGLERCFQK